MEEIMFSLNSVWLVLGALLVILMQGGFILLEAGSTRMKNAGHIAGKTVFTFGLASIVFWAVGYGFIFGGILISLSVCLTFSILVIKRMVCRIQQLHFSYFSLRLLASR